MNTTWKSFATLSCVIFIICLLIHFWTFNTAKKANGYVRSTTNFALYDLRIIVIVYDRDRALLRLLNSLNDAEYGSDNVKLEIWIDRSPDGRFNKPTLHAAYNFKFNHGQYSVNVHPKHVGIFGQWVYTWKPKNESSEIAVILEDDLTVSPYFYKYLKLVHNMYDDWEEINGYSLQGASMKHHIKDNSRLQAPKDSPVFLYPVIGTWGFSPNTKNWIKFINWCNTVVRNDSFQPYVPDNIATIWFKQFQKQGNADSMWSIWHIYYAWIHEEFTLYPNFKEFYGLSVNWREKGLHYRGKEGGATNKLLTEWKPEYEHLPKIPVHLDIKGAVIRTEH